MKDHSRNPSRGPMDDAGPDPRLAEALRSLDPGTRDPGYWMRFQRTVLGQARDELARRRMMAEVTVGDLMTSWSRTLVPAALLAAAVAALMILQSGGSGARPAGSLALDEMLGEDIGLEVFAPASTERPVEITFASEGF